MYWRRFAVKDIPLGNHEEFDLWLRERWHEKDALLEQYLTTGRFPGIAPATNGATDVNGARNGSKAGAKDGEIGFRRNGGKDHIETEVKLAHWWEVGNIFVVLATFGLIANLAARVWTRVVYGES